MKFNLRNYEGIKEAFREETGQYTRSKYNTPVTTDKKKLPPARVIEIALLTALFSCLDNMPDLEEQAKEDNATTKSRIVTGVIAVMDEQIHGSQGGDNSLYRQSLHVIAGIDKKVNPMDTGSKAELVGMAIDFMASVIFKNGKIDGELKRKHPFSDIQDPELKFKGCYLRQFLDKALTMKSRDDITLITEKAAGEKASISSAFKSLESTKYAPKPWFNLGGKTSKEEDSDEDDEETLNENMFSMNK